MKKNIIIVIVALLALSFQSCSSWLDVQPKDKFTQEQIFSDKDGFYTAVNGIYTSMNTSNLYRGALSFGMVELLAKRYVVPSSNALNTNISNYAYTSKEVVELLNKVWESAYKNILTSNIILSNIDNKMDILGEREASILRGEMLAARAFMHFDMLRLFGPIYATSKGDRSIPYNEYVGDKVSPFYSAEDVLNNYILRDILEAESLLKQYDPVIENGPMIDEKVDNIDTVDHKNNAYRYRQLRFNYYAVLLLKARVQLYAGDKVAALITAKMLIEDPAVAKYFPFVDPNKILGSSLNPDRVFSSECLFGLYDKARGDLFKNYFDPASTSTSLLQPRTGFVNGILFTASNEAADYRKQSQWGTSTATTNSLPILIKHLKISDEKLFIASYSPLIRLSEAYMIAAECEPETANGIKHLNILRSKRGALEIPITESKANFDNVIMMEYSREFYGEGQMFFYYKRRNINLPSGNNGQSTSPIGIANNPLIAVPPIPTSETGPR